VRIIAGSLRGRRLQTPTWAGLRPTSDKLRETLFNILAARVAGARVLDAFAGTGALGIEALSRGAAHVTFVDADPRAARLIAANLERCGIQTGYTVVRASAARALAALGSAPAFAPFDIVLLDPPYDAVPDRALAGAEAIVAEAGLVVLEHDRRRTVPAAAGRLALGRVVRSGDSALAFYEVKAS
jgi:16S rRNA (guanine(966)-N(2))-methyltransferase RsmD